jgi:hypothetical protein
VLARAGRAGDNRCVKPRLALLALVASAVALIAFAPRESPAWDARLTPQEAMTGTGGRSLTAGSARVVRSTRETDSTGKQISDTAMEGVADFERKLVRYDRFTPEKSGSPRTMVLAGDLLYAQVPEWAVRLPGAKTWIKRNEARLSRQLGVSELPDVLADPVRSLGKLRDLVDVTRLGHEDVRGVETRHYRGTIPVPQVNSAITVEVWIDRQGRVRRIRDTYNLTKLKFDLAGLQSLGRELTGGSLPNQAAGDVWSVGTTEYDDFGVPVAIQVPPDSDVFEFGPGGP